MNVHGPFWDDVGHMLDDVARCDTFDGVRAVLLDDRFERVAAERARQGVVTDDPDTATFVGSGGTRSLYGALVRGGWWYVRGTLHDFVVYHPASGDTLSYLEGDVVRGDPRG